MHFLTFTVVEWLDVFTRKLYAEIIMDSLNYCQKEKGLLIHCYCIMSNHMHTILSSTQGNLSAIIRDFKSFTSKQIIKSILSNQAESRKDWMIPVFRKAAELNQRNKENQFWIQDNRPMECYSPKFTVQKMNYIHQNPVRAGIVRAPEDYIYSSAWNYKHHQQSAILDICFI